MLNNKGLQVNMLLMLLLLLKHVACAPTVYTYIDDINDSIIEYRYKSSLETWTNVWQRAGWETKVLTLEDASKHPLYPKFKEIMDEKNIVYLPRHSYMRNLAMEMTPSGGFFMDIFVYPLQKVNPDDVGEDGYAKLPNYGEMTFHDGIGGSAVSGNIAAWNSINSYLVDHIEKNAHDSLQKLEKGVIHYERNHLLINVFGTHDRDTCDKASSKFVVRLHKIDLRVMKVRPMKLPMREMMISKWFNFYNFVCWEKKIPASQLGAPFSG